MSEQNTAIELTPEVKITISAKVMWSGFIAMVAVIGTVLVTYYDIKAGFQKNDAQIETLRKQQEADARMVNFRLDKLEAQK